MNSEPAVLYMLEVSRGSAVIRKFADCNSRGLFKLEIRMSARKLGGKDDYAPSVGHSPQRYVFPSGRIP